MAADAPITKRLIISGLTPAITVDDLSRRLTSFGTVKAADGFGLPDGLGQSRNFGYVTLETTTSKLAKCMNLLSGSTWKGAKLRFGEAKPDYAERISLENQRAAEEPTKKKRKRHGAVYTEDMSLVTPENAAQRPGWKVSSLGRITKPVRMRPAHPLPEVQEELTRTKPKSALKYAKKSEDGEEKKKKKKRVKDPDTRARRKTIDMSKWGSVHLKGMFLDLEVPMTRKKPVAEPPSEDMDGTESGSEDNSDDLEADAIVRRTISPLPPSKPGKSSTLRVSSEPSSQNTLRDQSSKQTAISAPSQTSSTKLLATEIQLEKAQTLGLLASLFGGKDAEDDDWVGRESVGSDIDVDELVKGDVLLPYEDAGFEVVPKSKSSHVATILLSEDEGEDEDEEEVGDEVASRSDKMDIDPPAKTDDRTKGAPITTTKLKDLFSPREEEVGFSLLGHLDLDIELDEDLPFLSEQTSQLTLSHLHEARTQASSYTAPAPITLQTHVTHAPLVLNPKQALFFPLTSNASSSGFNARQQDVFDLAKDNGWFWRDPSIGFYKTESDDEIRKRWEEGKGELTKEWKRRWREAGKIRRRKRGTADGGDD